MRVVVQRITLPDACRVAAFQHLRPRVAREVGGLIGAVVRDDQEQILRPQLFPHRRERLPQQLLVLGRALVKS